MGILRQDKVSLVEMVSADVENSGCSSCLSLTPVAVVSHLASFQEGQAKENEAVCWGAQPTTREFLTTPQGQGIKERTHQALKAQLIIQKANA